MNKSELRREFLNNRKALSREEVARYSHLIAWHFFTYFEKQKLAETSAVVHTFLPIRRQNEVDTWLIAESLWERFPPIQIAVSVTDTATNRLIHYPLHPHTELQENRWGIPEPLNPDPKQTLTSDLFDLVLVPLLIFDKQGHRVGYGGGYYDRFLAECRPDCMKVGLSLFEPVERIDGVELTDVPLDGCVTSEGIHVFK